ncbi:MAG: Wzz/FepE/Etk N-terminal domain-containing protein [Lachnospiraceae bacterium]|nr:Wzz/FepE/Etk N-terminal domain-containing protein [Lachnospiraceae bacterium]
MEENQKSRELEIDLRKIFLVLWSNGLIIFLVAMVFGIIVFLFTSLFITPQYTSETKVFILNRTDLNSRIINSQDLNTSTYLTQDILQIVTCRPVLEQVISDCDLDMTTKQLKSQISVSNPTDTRFIVIKVEDPDPYKAQEIANSIREASADVLTDIMSIEAVNTVEEASMPTSKSSPNSRRDAFLGFIVGALAAIIGIGFNYMFNDTIKTSEDIEKFLELSVLGVVPRENDVSNLKSRMKKKNVSAGS